jgi:hypothetical protein
MVRGLAQDIMNWTIIIAAWGDRCVPCFLEVGLPAIREALAWAEADDPEILIYTDQPKQIEAALRGFRNQIRVPIWMHNMHRTLGACHKHALMKCKPGDLVALINADNIVSREVFAACEQQFARGKKLIACAGLRTNSSERPPIGENASRLLEWAWEHRHPWITECIWGSGRAEEPAVIHFVAGDSVVTHGFHLHPLAIKIDGRDLRFRGPTIDDDLVERFRADEMHVVTDPREMALIEISPLDERKFRNREAPFSIADIRAWALQQWPNGRMRANRTHRWFFRQPIRIRGEDDVGDHSICSEILAAL